MSLLFEMSAQERDSAAIMHQLNKAFISAVYEASKAKHVTQKELADRLGVDKSTVSRLLQGRGNPTFRTFSDVCAALGIKPELTFPVGRKSHNGGGSMVRAYDGKSQKTQNLNSNQPQSFASGEVSQAQHG